MIAMQASFTVEELTIRLHLNRSRVMIEAMTKQLADLHKDVSAADAALNAIRSLRVRGESPTAADPSDGCQCDGCKEGHRGHTFR